MATGFISHDTDCEECRAIAMVLTCADCGVVGLVTNCGHKARPRPISASSRGGQPVCEACEDRREDRREAREKLRLEVERVYCGDATVSRVDDEPDQALVRLLNTEHGRARLSSVSSELTVIVGPALRVLKEVDDQAERGGSFASDLYVSLLFGGALPE